MAKRTKMEKRSEEQSAKLASAMADMRAAASVIRRKQREEAAASNHFLSDSSMPPPSIRIDPDVLFRAFGEPAALADRMYGDPSILPGSAVSSVNIATTPPPIEKDWHALLEISDWWTEILKASAGLAQIVPFRMGPAGTMVEVTDPTGIHRVKLDAARLFGGDMDPPRVALAVSAPFNRSTDPLLPHLDKPSSAEATAVLLVEHALVPMVCIPKGIAPVEWDSATRSYPLPVGIHWRYVPELDEDDDDD